MVVSKLAVEDFRARELESWEWLKDEPAEDIQRLVDEVISGTSFKFGTELRQHQLVCFLIGVAVPEFLFFLDMGLGKTLLSLDLFRFHRSVGDARRMLVLVPNTVNVAGWLAEGAKHAPDLDVAGLDGTAAERGELLRGDSDVCVITYRGWQSFVCGTVGRKMVIDQEKCRANSERFDMVVFDESTSLKSHQTLSYRMARELSRYCRKRYALTGTPFGRDPADLWSQFSVVDNGETLGKTLGIFREAFFTQRKLPWGGAHGYEYLFDQSKSEELHRVLHNRSISYQSKECLDLPEQVRNEIEVVATPEIRRYYNKVLDGIREAGNDLTLLDNSFNNLRQLTSGFLGVKVTDDGEEVDRDIIEFDPNPKLDALVEFVDQIPLDERIVVFNHFIHSGEQIVQRLEAAGHKCSRLYGGTPQAEKKTVVSRFDRGDFRILVVNAQSGAIGLNLQVARYCIFFESPVSPIVRPQAEKRVHRLGQDRTVFYYDLVMRNSIDQKVLRYLREGKDLFKSLIRGSDHVDQLD